MIDDKSKVLFEYLLADARISVKMLAKIIHSSEATVINRIKKLEKEGFISRYDAVINWQKIPFIKKVYFVKIDANNKEFEKSIINQKEVFSLIRLDGLYNYQVWCFFRTKKQLKEFNRLIKKYQYQEIEINELVFPKVTFFDVELNIPVKNIKKITLKLGKIDITIMKYMAQGHGRDSLYEISKIIKIPYDSVHYHGKKLLNSDYFSAIIAQVGTNKFTLQITSLLLECSNKTNSEIMYNSLKQVRRVQSDAIGKENKILVHFLSQTHTEYRETLSKIMSIIPRTRIRNLLISYWKDVIINNRYPLEYFLNK